MSSSTYTPNLGIEEPATGAYANTWGDVANRSYRVIDAAIGGVGFISAPAPGSPYSLTTGQGTDSQTAQYPMIVWTGAPGGQGTVNIGPVTEQRLYIMSNQTTDGSAIAFAQGSGSVFLLQAGYAAQIYCDGRAPGSNVSAAIANAQFNSILVGNLTVTGAFTGTINVPTGEFGSLGIGYPTSVPDTLTINGLGPVGECQIRLVEVNGQNCGALLRNDGNNLYFMATAPGNPYGAWTSVPFYINLVTPGVVATALSATTVSVTATVGCSNLVASGSIVVDSSAANNGNQLDILFGGAGSGEGIGSGRAAGASNVDGLSFYTGGYPRVYITNAGWVGVNVWPDQMLTVAGYIHSTAGGIVFPDGTVQSTAGTGGSFGNINVAGTATIANLNATGGVSLGGASTTSTVNGALNVVGQIYHNGVPFNPGISGVGFWVLGSFQFQEPGIEYIGQGGIQINVANASPGNYGSVTFNYAGSSDARVKRNVRPLEGGLPIVNQLHLIEAEYNGLAGTREGERVVGVMAEELLEILPDSVVRIRKRMRPADIQEAEVLHVTTQEILYQTVLALQQLSQRVNQLEGNVVA